MIDDLVGITTDFQSWYNRKEALMLEAGLEKYREHPEHTDWAGLQWLNKRIKFEGFMAGPIGVFYGLPVEVRTQALNNPKEFVDYCSSTDNQIFLYDLTYIPNGPQYIKMDMVTFDPVFLEVPEISTEYGKWRVRYGELEVNQEETV